MYSIGTRSPATQKHAMSPSIVFWKISQRDAGMVYLTYKNQAFKQESLASSLLDNQQSMEDQVP